MTTTTHVLQGYGSNSTNTPQFSDILTVPTGKIAKVKFTSISVQNTTTGSEGFNWKSAIYCVPKDSSTEVLLDVYTANNYQDFSHYVIYPHNHGNGTTSGFYQPGAGQSAYNDYSVTAINGNNSSTGFFNPEFYLSEGEILRFMWRHDTSNMTDYEFFLRGFYLLEDVSA